eukprot:20143-Heterococcus_DN1.PRE.3
MQYSYSTASGLHQRLQHSFGYGAIVLLVCIIQLSECSSSTLTAWDRDTLLPSIYFGLDTTPQTINIHVHAVLTSLSASSRRAARASIELSAEVTPACFCAAKGSAPPLNH